MVNPKQLKPGSDGQLLGMVGSVINWFYPTDLSSFSIFRQKQRTVSVQTADYSILASDSSTIFTNEGATGTVVLSLPSASSGTLEFEFVVMAAQTLQILTDGTDVIRLGTEVTSPGGEIDANAIGNTIKMTAVNSSTWIAMPFVGEWNVS